MTAPRVFVSHSHHDDTFTTRFVADLRAAGVQVWVDVADMQHGDFMMRINDALMQSEWLVLVLTPDALRSPAVRAEVNAAINLVWQRQMHGVIPVVANAYDTQDVPPTWRTLHYYDATHDYQAALSNVIAALRADADAAAQVPPGSPQPAIETPSATLPGDEALHLTPMSLYDLGFRGRNIGGVECILPTTVFVAEGIFAMGSNTARDPLAFDDELPAHPVNVAAFSIGIYPVTVAEYACAVRAEQVPEPRINDDPYVRRPNEHMATWEQQLQHPDHPVVNVSWNHAVAYVLWLAQVTGQSWRLPTEAEWEKAARWDAKQQIARIFPWGDKWDRARANALDGGSETTTAVGAFAANGDASPYGAHDMAGNVWEWCSSLAKPYPYNIKDGRELMSSSGRRVMRGGSWRVIPRYARAASHINYSRFHIQSDIGFRLALGDWPRS